MIKYQDADVDPVFHALADPTRRFLVDLLSQGPATVSQLAEPLPISMPAVFQHLKVLENSGLIRSEKVGRVRTCHLEPKMLDTAETWIRARKAMWQRRLDRLDSFLAALPPENPEKKGKS